MKRATVTLLAFLIAVAAGPEPGRGDIGAGVAAYDGGDFEGALANFLSAAQAGDPAAQTALASLYHSGEGIARDPARAAVWYRHAAEQGDAVAAANLAALHAAGDGVRRDPAAAYAWLGVAAGRGNAWAKAERARMEASLTPDEAARAAVIAARVSGAIPPVVSGAAEVLDGQTVALGGRSLRLEGIAAPAPGQPCLLRGAKRDCGVIAAAALKDLTAGARVACRLRGRFAPDGTRYALCEADGYDLSEGMVHAGWARAEPSRGARYGALEARARAKKRGMWRAE